MREDLAGARDDSRAIRRMEWTVAALVTLVSLVLHGVFLTHAGALWRDEVNSVEFARMPSVATIWDSLRWDSFPLLHTLLLRAWMSTGWGGEDLGLRVLGSITGAAFVGAVWVTCRLLGSTVPSLALALLALNPFVVRAADSIRPYGLGMILILLTTGLLWKAIESPTRSRFFLAGLAAVLSVQCLYQNALLLFALCVGGMVVAWRRGGPKVAAAVGAIGVLAALTLLPYWPAIRAAASWSPVTRSGADMGDIVRAIGQTLQAGAPLGVWGWIGTALFSAGAGLAVWRSGSLSQNGGRALVLFGALVLPVAATVFLAAVRTAEVHTQSWHYVPLLAIVACTMEAIVAVFATTRRRRIGRLVLVLLIVAFGLSGWRQVQVRRTNVDLVASLLTERARPGDAIVVGPWYYGISFGRYYKGDPAWSTFPPLEDVRIHRYDLLKTRMAETNPIAANLHAMGAALQSGHRVWLVGGFPGEPTGKMPEILPPGPHPISGWRSEPYLVSWSHQAVDFLRSHVRSAEALQPPVSHPVSPLENVQVIVLSGWR